MMVRWGIQKRHYGLRKIYDRLLHRLALAVLDVILREDKFTCTVEGIARRQLISRLSGDDTPVVANVELRGLGVEMVDAFGIVQNVRFISE